MSTGSRYACDLVDMIYEELDQKLVSSSNASLLISLLKTRQDAHAALRKSRFRDAELRILQMKYVLLT